MALNLSVVICLGLRHPVNYPKKLEYPVGFIGQIHLKTHRKPTTVTHCKLNQILVPCFTSNEMFYCG